MARPLSGNAKTTVERSKKYRDSRKNQLIELQKQVDQLTMELDNFKRDITDKPKGDKRDITDKLTKELDEAKDEIETLKEELKQARGNIKALEAKVQRYEEERQ